MAGNIRRNGVNPFQTDLSSTLTQLSVEQDFQTGGNDNIFGEKRKLFGSYQQRRKNKRDLRKRSQTKVRFPRKI